MTRIFPARASLALAALPAALIAAWATPQATMPADKPVQETPTVEIAPEKIEKPQRWVTAVEPKPLSDATTRGLTWLMEHQQSDGGWNQGEESRAMGVQVQAAPRSNVGDSAAALLALMRSGSTPSDGPYAEAIRRGVKFLLGKVEASDPSNLSVTDVNGTRLQMKLGPNIDTFLASMVLTEASGHMPDQTSTNRVAAALDKVLYKIQVNQDDDGRWTGRGWAPALANSLAVKGLNRAAQRGFAVDASVLVKAAAKAEVDVRGGQTFEAGAAAGVALYAGADRLSTLSDTVNTNAKRKDDLKQQAENAPTEQGRLDARKELVVIADTEEARDLAQQAVVKRLDDPHFIAGFGSNGGEEFLSYMNIGESLVVKGGEEWTTWDEKMSGNMERIQNGDGSWTGHHCITGRTFCTASALMVLMTDRTPVPAEAIDEAPTAD